MTYPRLVAVTWTMVLLLATLATCHEARAGELSLVLGAGMSTFQNTLPDSVWYQQGNNWNQDNGAFSWKAGLSYAFNERHSLQLAYANYGTTRMSATFWDDPDYDLKTKSCKSNCNATGNLTASDAMQGIELSYTRTWHPAQDYSIGLRAGGAYVFHRFTVENYNQSFAQKHYGRVPMGLVGLSVGYKWASLESTLYKQFGPGTPDSYPISTQFVTTLLTVHIPLGG